MRWGDESSNSSFILVGTIPSSSTEIAPHRLACGLAPLPRRLPLKGGVLFANDRERERFCLCRGGPMCPPALCIAEKGKLCPFDLEHESAFFRRGGSRAALAESKDPGFIQCESKDRQSGLLSFYSDTASPPNEKRNLLEADIWRSDCGKASHRIDQGLSP